jgi:DNA-binding NtrC family response regulator
MPTIFIVDDDELILKSLARMLRRPGFTVRAFGSAQEVLDSLGEGPDLLISDYHLPSCDGIDLAAAAKKAAPGVKTAILSGGVEDERVAEAMQNGTLDRFLQKPWRHDDLLQAVDDLLMPKDPAPP